MRNLLASHAGGDWRYDGVSPAGVVPTSVPHQCRGGQAGDILRGESAARTGGVRMSCDLEQLFAELATRLPTSSEEEIRLSAATLPRPPVRLMTDRLYIGKGDHQYHPAFRADRVDFHADKATYRHLGLLMLSVVFHAEPEAVQIELTHPASAIKLLVVESPYKGADDIGLGYNTRPHVFSYWPGATSRIPWVPPADLSKLPCFYLTNRDNTVGPSEQDWADRDTVRGFGTDEGSVRLAELLLNASQPNNLVDEYTLEGDGGCRGVGFLSAEARFWLPGSVGWDPDQ